MKHMIRTQEEWLKEFDITIPKCRWFIDRYEGVYDNLAELRKELKVVSILRILNDIWFELPDSFNIMNEYVMNNGWGEFLNLIEFWNEEEARQITKEN